MFPVREADFFAWKNGFLSHIGHKTAADIGNNGETYNGVFLPFFLYRLTCGAYLLSGVGMVITLTPHIPEVVCGYA